MPTHTILERGTSTSSHNTKSAKSKKKKKSKLKFLSGATPTATGLRNRLVK